MCARLLSHMEPFSWAPATEYTNVLELDAFKCTWTFASMNSIYELCEASSVILPTWVPHSWHNSLHDSFGSVIVAHAWWKLLAELSLSLPASSLSKRWIWHCIHWSNLSRGRTATWRSLAAERIEVRKSRNCFLTKKQNQANELNQLRHGWNVYQDQRIKRKHERYDSDTLLSMLSMSLKIENMSVAVKDWSFSPSHTLHQCLEVAPPGPQIYS